MERAWGAAVLRLGGVRDGLGWLATFQTKTLVLTFCLGALKGRPYKFADRGSGTGNGMLEFCVL